jgi:hypothetical protein
LQNKIGIPVFLNFYPIINIKEKRVLRCRWIRNNTGFTFLNFSMNNHDTVNKFLQKYMWGIKLYLHRRMFVESYKTIFSIVSIKE